MAGWTRGNVMGRDNHVYVFGVTDYGPVKIGRAQNPERRLWYVQAGHPYRLKVLRVWKHSNAWAVEIRAHRLLESVRLVGEWFSIGLAAAVLAIEQAILETDAKEVKEDNDNSWVVDALYSLTDEQLETQRQQQIRGVRRDEIEAGLGRRLSRSEITALERAGEFGEYWAKVRA